MPGFNYPPDKYRDEDDYLGPPRSEPMNPETIGPLSGDQISRILLETGHSMLVAGNVGTTIEKLADPRDDYAGLVPFVAVHAMYGTPDGGQAQFTGFGSAVAQNSYYRTPSIVGVEPVDAEEYKPVMWEQPDTDYPPLAAVEDIPVPVPA